MQTLHFSIIINAPLGKVAEGVKVAEDFEPETENSHELQREGWQAILENFRKYVEK